MTRLRISGAILPLPTSWRGQEQFNFVPFKYMRCVSSRLMTVRGKLRYEGVLMYGDGIFEQSVGTAVVTNARH